MAEEDTARVVTRQEGQNVIIHERTDSGGFLNALFRNAGDVPAGKTFLERKSQLPPSFFKPGESSKEFSGVTKKTTCLHERARSSPASIPGILTLPPENPSSPSLYSSVPVPQNQPAAAVVQQPQHFRHKSVPNPLSQASFRLCDPIINISTQFRLAYQPDSRIVFQNKATGEIYQDSAEARDHILGPLPRDWGQTVDRGETYYVDHAAKTTTWFDPRLSRDIQEPFVQSRHQQNQANQQQQQLQQQQFNVQRSIPSQQAPQQPRQLSRPAPASQLPLSMTQQLLQYPQQQQQQSNFSAAPLYASRAAAHPAQSAAALPQLHTNTQPSVNNIERLELERRDMRQRQEEIQQLELFNQQNTLHVGTHRSQLSQASGMQEEMRRRQMADGSPISPWANVRADDPLLYHRRQESADSGFCATSTPHTPENFLSQNMEELSLPYANPGDIWPHDASSAMDVDTPTTQQLDQIMSDDQVYLSDMYLSDLESVLRDDKDPFAAAAAGTNPNVTWL